MPSFVPQCFAAESDGAAIKARLDAIEARNAALEAKNQALQKSNEALAERVRRIDERSQESWLSERRADETRQLIQEVLADADTRASLLADGAVAGHSGKSFFVGSADGTFLLNFMGQIQMRYVYDVRDDADAAGGAAATQDDEEGGFELRRVKLAFTGHVGDPKFNYMVRFRFDRNTGTGDAELAWISHQFAPNFSVMAGRQRDPFLREEITNDTSLLAVERSLVNAIFTTDYTEGVVVRWDPADAVKLAAGINDGSRSGNVGGGSPAKGFAGDLTDWAISARADVKLAGDWKQMDDWAAWSGEPMAIFVGGAIHYEVAETGDDQTSALRAGTDSFFAWTVDGSLETSGFNVYAAVVGEHDDAVAGGADLDHYAFLVQAGYMVIPDKLEPFVRYEHIAVDSSFASGGATAKDIDILTFGFNYYFRKHASKFTLDVVWAMDPLTAANTLATTGSLGGLGMGTDSANADDQYTIRAQFQLLF